MMMAQADAVPGPASSAAVLLVDDTPSNLLALDAVLGPLGVRTVTARSGREALGYIVREPFAVALVDVQMPEMDGFELTRRMRETEHGRELPVLFVTAIHRDESYVKRGYASGAADYITKPYDPDIIRARVKAFVDLYEQREAVRRGQVALRTLERDEAIRRLIAFERIATAALETSDLQALLDELLRAFTGAADAADSATILLRDGEHLKVEASVGLDHTPSLKIGEGFAGTIAAERRPMALSEAWQSPLVHNEQVRAAKVRGLYGVPLLHNGEVLGVAHIGSTRASIFTEGEKRLFAAAAERAALAVARQLELSRLHEILTAAPACIAIVQAPEFEYTFVNPAYGALFGQGLVGTRLAERGFGQNALKIVEQVQRTGETHQLSEVEVLPATSAASSARYLRFTAQPLRNPSGTVGRVLIFAVDVTPQVVARREIEATQAARAELLERERTARHAAELASTAKDEFLATVSHELRTPLNAILGWASLARSKPSNDMEKSLTIIERNARAQARIVEDVLDFSRIARGKMRLSVGNIDLSSVVHEALEAVRPAAEAKGVQLEVALDIEHPLVGDADRIQQVVWNLLSNAVKFTRSGGRVNVRASCRDCVAALHVSDSGQGIDPEFLP
ncbi:MAG TPA: response regulator, partial [Polyangiaceae bacterium]|nr:response regulator [Polyangiaceae bacterium]